MQKNVRIAISEILLSTLPSVPLKIHSPPLLRCHLIKIWGAFLMRYVTHSQTSFPWTEDKQDPARVLFHHVFVTASLDFAPLSSGFIASHRVEL